MSTINTTSKNVNKWTNESILPRMTDKLNMNRHLYRQARPYSAEKTTLKRPVWPYFYELTAYMQGELIYNTNIKYREGKNSK